MSQLERTGEVPRNLASPMDVDPKLSKRPESSENKMKRPSFVGPQTMVTINISNGDPSKKQKFLIHKEFICYYSPFFNAAFNGNFKEGQTQAIDLDDVDPAVFALFVNWLYAQRILSDQEDDQPSLPHLISLWILVDRLLVPKLQNQALAVYDRTRVALNQRPASRTVGRIYKNTSPDSLLRKYIIQILASANWTSGETEPKWEYYPKELLIDMIRSMKVSDFKNKWVKFSEDELKQFFVKEDAEAKEAQEEGAEEA